MAKKSKGRGDAVLRVPVISSDVSEHLDLVVNHALEGARVPKRDYDAMAALAALLDASGLTSRGDEGFVEKLITLEVHPAPGDPASVQLLVNFRRGMYRDCCESTLVEDPVLGSVRVHSSGSEAVLTLQPGTAAAALVERAHSAAELYGASHSRIRALALAAAQKGASEGEELTLDFILARCPALAKAAVRCLSRFRPGLGESAAIEAVLQSAGRGR
jgi:hypothetical protein